MMNLIFFFLLLAFATPHIYAEVKTESACYSYQSQLRPYKYSKLILQYYYDTDLQKIVGGFVRYNYNKETIPLVFQKKISADVEDPGLGNFEIHWLEIVDSKITGTYVLGQTGAGNRQGRYVDYFNIKTKKTITFQKLGEPKECE